VQLVAGVEGRGGARDVLLREREESGTIVAVEHDEVLHGPASAWGELSSEQRAAWKDRLERAGHWGEEMAETVFKGVLFGEIAGVVGNMVAG